MNPEDIAKVLDEIGKRVGPAGRHVWDVVIRQVAIESAIYLVAAIVFIGAAGVSLKLAIRSFHKEKRNQYDDGPAFIGGVFAGASVLAFTIGLATARAAAMYLLNPEYEAITRLLDKIVP